MIKNKEETVEKIKSAALEEFYRKGYAKASLRTICNRAGVTTGAMYFSFENKEYSLYLVKQIGIYAEGGTDRLIESLKKLHSN